MGEKEVVEFDALPGKLLSGQTRWSTGSGAISCLALKEPPNELCENI